MKKALSLLLALALSLSCTACSGDSKTQGGKADNGSTAAASAGKSGEAENGTPQYSVTFLCMTLGDMSFADSGKRGLDMLEEKYGFKTKAVEAGTDSSKYESYVIDVCEGEPDFVLSTSEFQEEVERAAKDYPDIRFIIFDVSRDVEVKSDNILYIAYAQNEGSYLVGMIAAAMSKNGVIGTVGGVQNPVICDFITGYAEGARAYNPDIKVITSWVGNWTDSAKMLELCSQQNSTYGADVFFPVAGGASLGAFEAALKTPGTWSIGVDSDQHAIFDATGNAYADVIVTSMLKQVDKSFVSVFEDYLGGEDYWGTVRVLGVKAGGVDYVNDEMLKENAPAEVIAQVEEAKQKIIDGELTVKGYKDFANEEEYNAYINTFAP